MVHGQEDKRQWKIQNVAKDKRTIGDFFFNIIFYIILVFQKVQACVLIQLLIYICFPHPVRFHTSVSIKIFIVLSVLTCSYLTV